MERTVKRVKKSKKSAPVMMTCEECCGKGEVQADCEVCGVPLTEANVERGSDCVCAKCMKEEEEAGLQR